MVNNDFNKLMSGDFLPKFVSVKRFWTPRSERGNFNPGFYRVQPNAKLVYEKNVQELADLEAAATGGSSSASMDTASGTDAVDKTVALLNAVTAASTLQIEGQGINSHTRTPPANE